MHARLLRPCKAYVASDVTTQGRYVPLLRPTVTSMRDYYCASSHTRASIPRYFRISDADASSNVQR